MKKTLIYFYKKYNGDFNKIYKAIKSHDTPTQKELNEITNKELKNYITILDSDYPTVLKEQANPPFVIKKNARLITGVLVDTKAQRVCKHTLVYNDYKDYYPLLECETFDIQRRTFSNGKEYDIYLDDLGLYKEELIPAIITTSACTPNKIVEVIYGNVFITQTNEDGETISIPDNEIEELLATQILITGKEKLYKGLRALV